MRTEYRLTTRKGVTLEVLGEGSFMGPINEKLNGSQI